MFVKLTQALDGSTAYGASQADIFQGQDRPVPGEEQESEAQAGLETCLS